MSESDFFYRSQYPTCVSYEKNPTARKRSVPAPLESRSNDPFNLTPFSSRGSSRTVLHCAHRTSTVLSCAFCEQEGWFGYSLPLVCKELKTVCETRRTRASFTRDPGGFKDGYAQPYSTSMIMVWDAVTRSWSFVAPVTVILRSP